MQPHIVKAFDTEVEKLNTKIMVLAKSCEGQLALATKAFTNLDNPLAQMVVKGDAHINRQQREIEDACVKLLVKRHPVAADLRHLLSAMKIATELERIGDYAANVAEDIFYMATGENYMDMF